MRENVEGSGGVEGRHEESQDHERRALQVIRMLENQGPGGCLENLRVSLIGCATYVVCM